LSALASIQEREPDLLVLDLIMPGMSGIEVCRAVKRNPFTARIPVLMLTARDDVANKVEAFEAGADDYLAKPFDPRELRARIVALLRIVRREGDRNPTSGLPGGKAIEDEISRGRICESGSRCVTSTSTISSRSLIPLASPRRTWSFVTWDRPFGARWRRWEVRTTSWGTSFATTSSWSPRRMDAPSRANARCASWMLPCARWGGRRWSAVISWASIAMGTRANSRSR